MFTKNIKFKNFIKPKDSNKNKYIRSLIKEKHLLNKYPLLNSLTKKFQYSYQKKIVKSFQNYSEVNIVGMGGSILGTEAIYDFLKHKVKKKFIFFNNIKFKNITKTKKKNLNLIISKSGNTLETICNFNLLLHKQKKNKNVILCEKKNNYLSLLGKKLKAEIFEHKNYIGGRYSVLSEVGMLPAHLMGVNIFKIRKNILSHLNSKNKEFLKESVKKLANLLNNNKFKNLIFFNYAPQLNEFLYWCQQLIAESLGKKGKGFLPVISPAPKDHHSLLQLYLDGPRDKIFYIFSLDSKYNDSLSKIKLAQKNAFLSILKKNKIPYREFNIRNSSEEVIGELFAYFMLETSIVGKTININPFNQPAVEQVKNNTKKILA